MDNRRQNVAKHPNIVWIMTDEQRPDSLGCYGSQWAKTPHTDALAARGVVMERAFCQSPVCAPSRASQLAARYAQEVCALHNDDCMHPFPPGTVTINDVLREAGYELANFGKWHAPKHDLWDHHEGPVNLLEYSGYFDLNDKYDEAAHHVIKRPGSTPIILAGTYPVAKGHPSEVTTDRAIAWLRSRDNDRPFMMRVSHNWPHTPVLPPPPWDSLYDPDELPIRYFDAESLAGRSGRDKMFADRHRMRDLTRDQIRQVWKDYMGLCACVDNEVGRLMSAIEELGLRDDTIVFYSVDHGKMLGEYGTGEKGVFDDQVWRVPFIWSAPGRLPEGEVQSDICELTDTGRTLLSLAGLKDRVPDSFRGRNLFGEPSPEAVFGQINYRMMRVAVRTDRYRMDVTWSDEGRRLPEDELDGNLFDLAEDPQERVNLYDDPGHANVRRDLLKKLETWQGRIDPYKAMPTEKR